MVQRGSATVWISDDFENNGRHTGEKQRGSQWDYSAQALWMRLTLKEVYQLTHRSVAGLVRSRLQMMHSNWPLPGHATLAKRGQALKVNLPKKAKPNLKLVMDSTSLVVYGEGEWKVRMHGVSKRRTSRRG